MKSVIIFLAKSCHGVTLFIISTLSQRLRRISPTAHSPTGNSWFKVLHRNPSLTGALPNSACRSLFGWTYHYVPIFWLGPGEHFRTEEACLFTFDYIQLWRAHRLFIFWIFHSLNHSIISGLYHLDIRIAKHWKVNSSFLNDPNRPPKGISVVKGQGTEVTTSVTGKHRILSQMRETFGFLRRLLKQWHSSTYS